MVAFLVHSACTNTSACSPEPSNFRVAGRVGPPQEVNTADNNAKVAKAQVWKVSRFIGFDLGSKGSAFGTWCTMNTKPFSPGSKQGGQNNDACPPSSNSGALEGALAAGAGWASGSASGIAGAASGGVSVVASRAASAARAASSSCSKACSSSSTGGSRLTSVTGKALSLLPKAFTPFNEMKPRKSSTSSSRSRVCLKRRL